jgi:ketosteroid isomerase-like protein
VSQENVELVRRGVEHFVATGEPDWPLLDADVEVYDHDILDAGDYRGLDGYARWMQDFSAPWSEFSISPEEYLDAGDHVIAVFRVTAIGAGSGVRVERQDAMVCEMRDMKLIRLDYFNNRAEALKAVGLED